MTRPVVVRAGAGLAGCPLFTLQQMGVAASGYGEWGSGRAPFVLASSRKASCRVAPDLLRFKTPSQFAWSRPFSCTLPRRDAEAPETGCQRLRTAPSKSGSSEISHGFPLAPTLPRKQESSLRPWLSPTAQESPLA